MTDGKSAPMEFPGPTIQADDLLDSLEELEIEVDADDIGEAFLEQIGVDEFFVYLHDFGAPVGYHLATRRSEANRARLPEWLNFEGTREQYLSGLPERVRVLHPPETWHLDWERMSRPGNVEAQFQLFCDYASHVARFGELVNYHRTRQPPACCFGAAMTRSSTCPRSWATRERSTGSRCTSTTPATSCSRPTRPSAPRQLGPSSPMSQPSAPWLTTSPVVGADVRPRPHGHVQADPLGHHGTASASAHGQPPEQF